MIDYDREASVYDATRGGDARAAAVASAVSSLLPRSGSVLDVACGTGIVTAALFASDHLVGDHLVGDHLVAGADLSLGMLGVAAGRLSGRVLQADAGRLPVASGSFDVVLMVWLLHLLPDAAPALREAVRVLAPGGRLITTVDKSAATFAVPSDLASATAPWRDFSAATDRFPLVASVLGQHGLRPVGEASFPGVGQGRSPQRWREAARAGRVPWAEDDPDGVDRVLAALPGQDVARPDPIYRLVAFSR